MIEFVEVHGLDDLKKPLSVIAKFNQGLYKSANQRDFLYKKYGSDQSVSLANRVHRDFPGVFSSLIKPDHVFRFACDMRLYVNGRTSNAGTMDTFIAVDQYGVIAIFKVKHTAKHKEILVRFNRDPHLKLVAPVASVKAPGHVYADINKSCGEIGTRCQIEGEVIEVIRLKSGYSDYLTHVDCDGKKLQYWGLLKDKSTEAPIGKGQRVKIDGKIKKVDISAQETVTVMGRVYSSQLTTMSTMST